MYRRGYYGLLTDKGSSKTLNDISTLDLDLEKMYHKKNHSRQQHLYDNFKHQQQDLKTFVDKTLSNHVTEDQLVLSVRSRSRPQTSKIAPTQQINYFTKPPTTPFAQTDIPAYLNIPPEATHELNRLNTEIQSKTAILQNKDTQIYHLRNMITCLIAHYK